MTQIILRQIGVVCSVFKERKAVPRLGGPASVEVLPAFADGLLRLEKHSHLWVLVWLDQAERDVLQVIPRGVTDPRPENLHGVFAVRSPARPNPIGMTLARSLGIQGRSIGFDRLDFVDGTPVVDLKPYFRSRDAVLSATNLQIGKPADRKALRDSLRILALNFQGEPSPELELAVDLYTHFRCDLLDMEEPRDLDVSLPLDRPALVDALIGMTGASPGRGTMLFVPEPAVTLSCSALSASYALSGTGFAPPLIERNEEPPEQ